MELRNLETFKVIIEEGSFAKAAEKLNYTQSTITFRVRQLEKELSVKLFEKLGRSMVLTKEGEELIPYVMDIFRDMNKIRNFRTNLEECTGNLRIGAPESLLCFLLPRALKQFHEQAPRIHLFLDSMNSRNVRNALRENAIDIGIFYQDSGGNEEQLETTLVGRFDLTVFASPAVKKRYPNLNQIGGEYPLLSPIVQPMPGSLGRRFQIYLDEQHIRLGNKIEIRSTQTIKNLVKNDMGLCYLPRFVVQEELDRGELVEIKIGKEKKQVTAVCGIRKDCWVSPAMKLFFKLVREKG
ncbi:MAG: LysR family transcriptional regulator [Dialister sp.]|nr:LysR family transcriptional regulator [Dialister sp.]